MFIVWDHGAVRSEIDPLLVQHFAVLRRRQVDGDIDDERRWIPRVVQSFGLIPGRGRRVTLADGALVWVIPGSRGMCLSKLSVGATGRASWCASLDSVARTGIWGLNEDLAGRQSMWGLVPDGNDGVTVALVTGETRTVLATEGVVVINGIKPGQRIEYLDAAGQPHLQMC
jgi:hypothetical protein